MRILVAKLNGSAPRSLSIATTSEHDVVDFATDLDECIELLRDGPYDVALVVGLQSEVPTRAVIERVRREAGQVPLVVLATGTVESAPAVAAEAPAAAPVSEHARAVHGGEPAPRSVELNMARGLVSINGRPLLLSQAEFQIFALLWRRCGKIVGTDELLSAIYGSHERPASRVLPVFMFKLRRKLAAAGMDDLIQTAVGRGFIIRNPD